MEGFLKKLRQGKLSFQSKIDLHSMNVVQAKIELLNFIEECEHEDFGIALVVHGRGGGEGETRSTKKLDEYLVERN